MAWPMEEVLMQASKMESAEEDVVVLDADEMYYDDEYEILEDLITIEDEGIMDISNNLRQRDFDEYINSLRKDTNILPQSFCRIKQNVKLLDTCRPLKIEVVDYKKSKIFYNDELAVNLKTRENVGDKFKEILSDYDNISDDDTIEIDVDIEDEEMEDLIKIDYVQENQVDAYTNFEIMNKTECDFHSNMKSSEIMYKNEAENHMSSKNSKKRAKNKNRPKDKSMKSAKKVDKNIIKEARCFQLNIEMQKIADMLKTLEGLKSANSEKTSRKSLDLINNDIIENKFNVTQKQNSSNAIPNSAPRPRIVERPQDNINNIGPKSNMEIKNSKPSNLIMYPDPHLQKPEPLVPTNNNLHNNNCNSFPNKNTQNSNLPKSLASINFMKKHLEKLAKANENSKSIKIRPIHNYGLSNNVKEQEFRKSGTSDKFYINQKGERIKLKKITKIVKKPVAGDVEKIEIKQKQEVHVKPSPCQQPNSLNIPQPNLSNIPQQFSSTSERTSQKPEPILSKKPKPKNSGPRPTFSNVPQQFSSAPELTFAEIPEPNCSNISKPNFSKPPPLPEPIHPEPGLLDLTVHSRPSVPLKNVTQGQNKAGTESSSYSSPILPIKKEIGRTGTKSSYSPPVFPNKIGIDKTAPESSSYSSPVLPIKTGIDKTGTESSYSPPVLPIPTFRRTFEILAHLNLISKFRYRRNRHMFKYVTVNQSKVLSNRSITKDLAKYSKL